MVRWLSLRYSFAVVYHILSTFVHAFGLQTSITAECSSSIARQWPIPWEFHHGGHFGMRPPTFRTNRSMVGGRPPSWILKTLIFDHVTVIEVLICCCVPNFIKIASRVRPPDAHNCWIRCHGNCIMADMSGTCWDATVQVSSKSVYWQASYSISNIFQYGGRPPSWIGILSFFTTHKVNVCGSITLSKFGVDPVFAIGDIAILWFCQFGWKVPKHAPFWGFLGVWTP